ncbi:MAG: hypothetical protein WDN30_03915 [Pararobbsia sp.]
MNTSIPKRGRPWISLSASLSSSLRDHALARDEVEADRAKQQQAVLPQAHRDVRAARYDGRGERRDVVRREPLEVGVEQHQQRVLRGLDAGGHRRALAAIDRARDQPHAREALDHLGRAVGRAVVDDDDFVKQGMRGGHREHRADPRGFIERTDDAGNARPVIRHRRTGHGVMQLQGGTGEERRLNGVILSVVRDAVMPAMTEI